MKLIWKIEEQDIEKTKTFYERHKHNNFVQSRIKRNIELSDHEVTESLFWKAMVACLLTTQQRSGPNRPVVKFICKNPFDLDYSVCSGSDTIKSFIEDKITAFGGIRRAKRIAEEINANFLWLEKSGGWNEVLDRVRSLPKNPTSQEERETARFLAKNKNLKGFGPKQSRNLLQFLGLTRYEIPIDSRIVKWLNELPFPVRLSANALADEYYYSFVLDGLQELCEQCKIYPCVLDAVIFSSSDPEWQADSLFW